MVDQQSEELPPGFGGVTREHGLAPHPATELAFTTLTFQARPDPWYRSNAAKLALVVLGLAAAVAALVVLLWPSAGSELRPRDANPTSTPSATPTPSPTQSAPPSAEPAPPAPPVGLPPGPPPPEPPPLTAEQMAPPAAPPRYYPPQYDEPTQKKPDVDVTRAPISVAPSITAPTGPSGSAVPGEQRKRRGFF